MSEEPGPAWRDKGLIQERDLDWVRIGVHVWMSGGWGCRLSGRTSIMMTGSWDLNCAIKSKRDRASAKTEERRNSAQVHAFRRACFGSGELCLPLVAGVSVKVLSAETPGNVTQTSPL